MQLAVPDRNCCVEKEGQAQRGRKVLFSLVWTDGGWVGWAMMPSASQRRAWLLLLKRRWWWLAFELKWRSEERT